MRTQTLVQVQHKYKVNDEPDNLEPTLQEDTLFVDESGTPIGFYLAKLPSDIQQLVNIANNELNSERVPKTLMERKQPLGKGPDGRMMYRIIEQYSCILGSIPPKPHMKRTYANRSSVHTVPSARNFVKAMILTGQRAMQVIKDVDNRLYKQHTEAVSQRVPERWRFAEWFTSSISNCNIAARMHRDNLNVKGSLNVIITKRSNATGGNLVVPDYNTTFNSADNSLLVYPAWRNMHGVTPIQPTHPGGYRNSLIWYALDAFSKH